MFVFSVELPYTLLLANEPALQHPSNFATPVLTIQPDQSVKTPTLHAPLARARHVSRMLDMAAAQGAPLVVRFGCLAHAATEGHHQPEALIERICQRWKVPADCRDLALLLARQAHQVDHVQGSTAQQLMALLQACDALRRPQRMAMLLLARELSARAHGVECYVPKRLLQRGLEAAQSVDVATVAAQAIRSGMRGPEVGHAVREAQRLAVDSCLSQSKGA